MSHASKDPKAVPLPEDVPPAEGVAYLDHERVGDRWAAFGMREDALEAYREALRLRGEATWIARKIELLEADPGFAEDVQPPPGPAIILFMPFYAPKDLDRRTELETCLRRNLENQLLARIVLLIDDGSVPPFEDPRLEIIRLDQRPSYLDWVTESRRRFPGRISILANSDIFLDESLALINHIFAANRLAFVALTRFDQVGGKTVPHPNPHYSQDVWAFMAGPEEPDLFDHRLQISLGIPRCDNKIAYVFSLMGYEVFNPFPFVRSVHFHESGRRYYDKTGDRTIMGTVAFVHPGADLLDPAKLELSVFSSRTTQYSDVKINRSIERWDAERGRSGETKPALVAYDADWQYPAITEQHALRCMRRILSPAAGPNEVAYLGFPFATLIDVAAVCGRDDARTRALVAQLDALRHKTAGCPRVVSVCQHIHARKYADFFERAGITDLFWSHKIAGEEYLATNPRVMLHPFPLFPVQRVPRGWSDRTRRRKWLFSFVGSRPGKSYLTPVRTWLLDELVNHPGALIIDRDEWHYERLVYDLQIRQRAIEGSTALNTEDNARVFREVLDESTFTLCPSGSGPNTLRVWEALLNGSVPVVLSDNWHPPGPPELWARAVLRIPEERAAIRGIPGALEQIVEDPAKLRDMRAAGFELSVRYGPGNFCRDIAALFPTPAKRMDDLLIRDL